MHLELPVNLVRVEEIVKKEDYVKNLKDNLGQCTICLPA